MKSTGGSMASFDSLSVGCGGSDRFRGRSLKDVNIDVLKPSSRIDNFVLCDAHSLPFKEGAFESVLLSHVVEHLNSPFYCLVECRRVLRDGGRVFVETPNACFILKVARLAMRGFYEVDRTHVQTYGVPELKQLVEKSGFSDIVVSFVGVGLSNLKFRERLICGLFRSSRPLASYSLLAVGRK